MKKPSPVFKNKGGFSILTPLLRRAVDMQYGTRNFLIISNI
jgi:hypothetical protein